MTASVSFISNTGETHKEFLLNLFKKADKVIFAVGFLKPSGLNNIKEELKKFCADKTKYSTFYIGTGLGETDPDSLQSLFNIIKSNANHQLVLCSPDAGIFHPKIYVFISDRNATIVIGSSNLTQHGWVVNDEVSMALETTVDSREYLQLNKYFKDLQKKYNSINVDGLIHRYKKERDEHINKFSKPPAFRFRRKRTKNTRIDMPRLKRYYEIYKSSDDFIIPSDREKEYKQAKSNLESLAAAKEMSDAQFHKLFGPLVGHKDYKPKLWHSGSIHRTTYKTLDYPDSFREIVRAVKLNLAQPVNKAFDNVLGLLKDMKKAKSISGIGVNIITEIFLSYDSRRFANLNDNPIAVLSLVGKDYPISAFKGDDYADYVNLMSKIKDDLRMATFLEIDSFFNYVYWNLIEE